MINRANKSESHFEHKRSKRNPNGGTGNYKIAKNNPEKAEVLNI